MDDSDILQALIAAGLTDVDAKTALAHWRHPATRFGADAMRVQSVIDSLSR